ncbi:MAG TPA: polysaccharide deacetylase family protein [Actinomycetota bacterium]
MTRSGRHRRRFGRHRRELGAFAVALLVVFLPGELGSLPPPMHVSVAGSVRVVRPGATVDEARELLGLRPRGGNLLDVEGRVLRRRVVAGHLTVNGVQASGDRVLQEGDRLEVVDGVDATEGTVRVVVEVEAGTPSNPQTYLGSAAGVQVIERGEVSGKVVASVFHPSGPAQQPDAVALTFDDGPSSAWTLRVARTLRRLRAVATFFVVGYLAERYPDIVERLAAMGMRVGNHSQNHPYERPFARLSQGQVATQIGSANRALASVGVESSLFRPPGGSWSPRTLQIASDLGQRTVLWSVDSLDWTGLGPAQIATRVLEGARPGAIVLLHDGGGNRRATLQALPRIVRGLRAMGLSLRVL